NNGRANNGRANNGRANNGRANNGRANNGRADNECTIDRRADARRTGDLFFFWWGITWKSNSQEWKSNFNVKNFENCLDRDRQAPVLSKYERLEGSSKITQATQASPAREHPKSLPNLQDQPCWLAYLNGKRMAFKFRIKRHGNRIFSKQCPASRHYCWLSLRGAVEDRRFQCTNFLRQTSMHKNLCTLDKSTSYYDGEISNGP
ncbi:hypothetical protein LCGC14_0829060, partial [marine sediment metagenome]